ncbi:hypothetical protein LINGRAHAP2_LOCUS19797 [Linum grandiflorum]
MCILDPGAAIQDLRPAPLRYHASLLVHSG